MLDWAIGRGALKLAFAEVLDPFTLAVVATAAFFTVDLAFFFVVAGNFITFEVLGVFRVVQNHLPLARAQAWPSLALLYRSVWLRVLPNGSSNLTWPPVLDILRFVSTE